MDKFDLTRTVDGDQLRVPKKSTSVLRYPLYNKGAGFTSDERRRFHLEGLLPAQVNDISVQAQRVYKSIMFNPDPLGRHIDLAALQDRNEHLYYRVLADNLETLMPIVYTPTVGQASQYFSRVFRRARGIWITPHHTGRIEDVLRYGAPFFDVQLMVVTDNESILGIGDQGAGGMAISVGKLALYCAGAGIHPSRTLPISLDVGTDNEDLLEDPFYLGYRQKRLRGDKYLALVDEFVAAAKAVFPQVVIQWEDFRKDNALTILNRYRGEVPSFNDDIQGTGAVAYACIHAASRITGAPVTDSRVLVFGAGAAGYGIAKKILGGLHFCGLDGDELRRSLIAMDSRGVLSDVHEFQDYKGELAWPEEWVNDIGLDEHRRKDLCEVINAYKPNVLIGTSGQANSFNEDVARAMASVSENPVILPMSNPTSISEAKPDRVLRWTDYKALVATGSPFDDVETPHGPQRIGQANNVFIFPGLGLGTIVCGATEVTDGMIGAASKALADGLNDEEIGQRCLMPEVNRLWDICGDVAVGVAERAMRDGVAEEISRDELQKKIDDYRWKPVYPEMIEG
ncbi:MAG: NAD-dependent malic enzyme [Gammaproteobacteria bacterium]|nr:NAD-dependent malic enzyme [Gammaproteobacteria bacterium]